jgi:5-methyltetrahydropteroyltriglutamate--homocysteine methyltransferase
MKNSATRVLTTHVGRLQRPEDITAAMEAHAGGRPHDTAFAAHLRDAVAEVVAQQVASGIDIVCDGEFGKLSWNLYLNTRLGGHAMVPADSVNLGGRVSRDRREFAEFYAELEKGGAHYYRSPGRDAPPGMRWVCNAPVTYTGEEDLRQDLDFLKAAIAAAGNPEAFVPATSPVRPWMNAHYATDLDYYTAVGEAMRTEYRAIIDAGFLVQIDDPYLPELWNPFSLTGDVSAFRHSAAQHVEIINHALRGLPQDRIRYHICWGSWHGPHAHDLPLRDVVDLLLKVNAQGYVIEAANARHEHEWQIWRDVPLPADKILIPGVVSHATNVVEHPDLVAMRIANFASAVGRERVIASTDCGMGYRVHPQIGWAKLATLAEGARRASAALWP